jgi:hypothetical protein
VLAGARQARQKNDKLVFTNAKRSHSKMGTTRRGASGCNLGIEDEAQTRAACSAGSAPWARKHHVLGLNAKLSHSEILHGQVSAYRGVLTAWQPKLRFHATLNFAVSNFLSEPISACPTRVSSTSKVGHGRQRRVKCGIFARRHRL